MIETSPTAPVHLRQPFQADLPVRLQRKWTKYVSLERLTYIRCAVVLALGSDVGPISYLSYLFRSLAAYR
jgi:hypothetical protein